MVFAAIFGVAALSLGMQVAGVEGQLVFVVAGVGVAGLAWALGEATEQAGGSAGPRVSALLNASFGNLPELVIRFEAAATAAGAVVHWARDAAEACARLFERPVERGLSQAALETLAIVAYLGPCTRPEVARIRGVSADAAVAGLVERGLVAEAGRDRELGAVRYATTPLFERVFGLESLAELPRVDDVGADATEIRERLEAVAEKRPA